MTREVVVADLWDETPDVRCFELRPVDPLPLPPAEPGAHIDVHVGPSLIRQYSLWNGPAEAGAYFIGVKREPHSRGGSVAMHRLTIGSRLTISPPRNNFRLAANDAPALLLAGGIGITPLLAMARHLDANKMPFQLHLFSRSRELAPFASKLAGLAHARVHCGVLPPTLDGLLTGLLAAHSRQTHVYICGPSPFMELAARLAAGNDLPPDNIHLEYFAAEQPALDASALSFDVEARQSGITVTVAPHQTIAQALIDAGVDLLTSCEQGVCGTCATAVLEGEPDHRDQYLNRMEHASGKIMTPCVSRCKGGRLVLDI